MTYKPEHALLSFDLTTPIAEPPKNVLGEPAEITVGDAEAALAQAPFAVDHLYHTPRHNHAAIELHAVTVVWRDGALTVHDSTQMLNLTASTFAEVFGIKMDKVRILSPFVGGGFGNKHPWSHHFLAAAAAKC